MTQVRAPDIATKEEVLETFTQLMRGEKTAEHMIRLENGKKLCVDCSNPYTRGI